MIQEIQIDGFRSLVDFSIKLQPGLNIIVGANGTGKSNFISFLDFLGTLTESGLNAAIAIAQGAGSVFSKERVCDDKPIELTYTLNGMLHKLANDEASVLPFGFKESSNTAGSYSYRCTVCYLSRVPAVFISSESLEIVPSEGGRINIARSTSRSDADFKTRIDIASDDSKFAKSLFRYLRASSQKIDVNEFLGERVAPERSVLQYLAGESFLFALVYNDLTRYRSVNIDPGIARRPTPVGSVSSLQSNGEGLAGALYQLKKGVYLPGRMHNRYVSHRSISKNVFNSIVSWCKEVNPLIDNVDVELNVMEAQFRPFMYFKHQELMAEKFPFRRISDGTVKWLALTTVLFAEPDLSLIEEPENFLHPFMQETFIALCRQALELDEQKNLIISTHSPTVLDCCRPAELTLFELVNGQTHAARIADREELENKLKVSRFGLGHYYKIGALYGENTGDC
jgi:predicted ATPase